MTNCWNRIIYALWPLFYDPLVGLAPMAAARRRAILALDLQPKEKVLLVGAGTGADLPLLTPGVRIAGVDLSAAMLDRARTKAVRLGLPADLRVADAQRLPYPDGWFDAAVLNLILAVVPDPRRCLAETLRVLRPGGRAVVFDKFLPPSQTAPHPGRVMFNFLTRIFGTDINRRFEEIVSGQPAEVIRDEPDFLRGTFRVILLHRPAD